MGRWIGRVHDHDVPVALDVLAHAGEVWECECGGRFLLDSDGYWVAETKAKPFVILSEEAIVGGNR